MPLLAPTPGHAAVARVKKVPLHAHSLLAHAAAVHPNTAVISLSANGDKHTSSYAELAHNALQRTEGLLALGIAPGDTLCSIGLSSVAQLEVLYAALSVGACTHLMNPQFAAEDAVALTRCAEPRVLLHDAVTADLARHVHALLGAQTALLSTEATWPAPAVARAGAPGVRSGFGPAINFPEETPAFVCYSSGTTGTPKAVEYTHRSTVLHAWACALPDALNLSAADRVMPLMQLYHASAWGAPFVSPLVGAALVLVPPHRDPGQWYRWIEDHGITVLGAVTAHWVALASYMRLHRLRFSTLRRTVVGGTRLTPDVAQWIADTLHVEVRHAWGMTETSPLATVESYRPGSMILRHGKPVFGIELSLLGAIPTSPRLGELQVRGHWVAHRSAAEQGWLRTGDLATLSVDGHWEVLDRLDDAVATSDRLISSALVEHEARSVDGVADAALLVLHDTDRSSVLALVLVPDSDVETTLARVRERVIATFDGWLPEHIVEIDAFPYTPSAKVQKHLLRRRLATGLAA